MRGASRRPACRRTSTVFAISRSGAAEGGHPPAMAGAALRMSVSIPQLGVRRVLAELLSGLKTDVGADGALDDEAFAGRRVRL